jgi:multidrug efflux pump subunit AcrB
MMEIIKQADENMSKMQGSLDKVIDHLRNSYPDIEFNISQNQTELLDFTISNLQQNLILAFIFVCLVSIFFMRDIKSPLIIGFSVLVSLVISLMFFYLFRISFNIVSLTGLILAIGLMIDNSIIVTDNIGQHREWGLPIVDACVKGTNEVITPMLSSMFTTIVIFVPLIFLSGIAGAIFFDQAFSVTIGLIVAFFTGIMLLPVLYKIVYSPLPRPLSKRRREKNMDSSSSLSGKIPESAELSPLLVKRGQGERSLLEKFYDTGFNWVFSHKTLSTVIIIGILPLCYVLFTSIRKEKMPDISQNELLVFIEWNENIHVGENGDRTLDFLRAMDNITVEHSAMVAQQQFILNREREQTASETQL